MLGDAQGVSLERLSYEKSGNDPGNWHSASAASGYATPGYRNSQEIIQETEDTLVTLSTSLLTPDNDGWDDVLSILLTPDDTGYLLSIEITDLYGYAVREIASAAIAGDREYWFWDGKDKASEQVAPGIYVVHVELLHPDGRRRMIRKAVAVTYR